MTRKILIVDDTETNRIILNRMLGAEYLVLEAASGEEALAVLDREYKTISAVLLDIGLPGIDGYDVLKKIRMDKRFSQMPVIMITASEDETTRVNSLKLKANDFLMKPYSPEILKHCLQNNIALHEATAPSHRSVIKEKKRFLLKTGLSIKAIIIASCVVSLIISLFIQHFGIQRELRTTCENVAVDFSRIMDSYQHSFRMFEMLLQQEIQHEDDPDEIEAFLKEQDKRLMAIEGGDYDGVYMYYQGRYLYSWDTPYSVYAESGYDATKRPWYIGAVAAKGEIFFSTPYPSYANDYMLATISRLQEDGETVIAYDIKLGEISKFVDKLNLYNGALALICDVDGNIIGSTDHLYLGGNYTMSQEQLSQAADTARQAADEAGPEDEEANAAAESAEAKQRFVTKEGEYLKKLTEREGALRHSLKDFTIGYAHTHEAYTCFVVSPMGAIVPETVVLWAAISFALIALACLVAKMMHRNQQILSDTLTGLNNRRALIKYCDNHIQHHGEDNLGLLMLDLNHFKKINDLYGHGVGDQALLDAAAVLKSACGSSMDNYFLCRYGGDEFLLAARIRDTSALDTMRRAISDGLAKKNETGATPYKLSASMGTSFGKCKDKKSLENLIALADQAMYNDKREAENQR